MLEVGKFIQMSESSDFFFFITNSSTYPFYMKSTYDFNLFIYFLMYLKDLHALTEVPLCLLFSVMETYKGSTRSSSEHGIKSTFPLFRRENTGHLSQIMTTKQCPLQTKSSGFILFLNPNSSPHEKSTKNLNPNPSFALCMRQLWACAIQIVSDKLNRKGSLYSRLFQWRSRLLQQGREAELNSSGQGWEMQSF